MKGDGFIKIKINIKGIYIYSDDQPYISVYDMNGCLISSGYADCGTYCVCLEKCERYKVIICYLNRKKIQYIFTDRCELYIFLNICSVQRPSSRTITFRLLDYYYNLPISKGVLNFGQTSNNN